MSILELVGCMVVITIFVPLLYLAYRYGYGSHQAKYAKKFHASTSLPPRDDADKSARTVMSYLYRRCEEMNLDTKEKGIKRAFDNIEYLHDWIRMFHAFGCEMVIRKVADSDIGENTKNLDQFQDEAEINWKKHYKLL